MKRFDQDYDDRFCFYCQKEFASIANLKKHVARIHSNTYADINLNQKETTNK